MAIVKITKQNFEEEVMKSEKPVLIDLWASWCGPCNMLGPVIEEIAGDHPEIKVGKVNVDEEGEIARAFNVSSIPMVVLLKGGKIVKTQVGYRPKKQIEDMLK